MHQTAVLLTAVPDAVATVAPLMDAPAPDFPIGQFLLNLVIVCGALLGLGWLANRVGKGRLAASLGVGPRREVIRIEDRLPVDPQRALLLVAIEGQRWLVGMGPNGFDRIGVVGEPAEVVPTLGAEVVPTAGTGSFADALARHQEDPES